MTGCVYAQVGRCIVAQPPDLIGAEVCLSPSRQISRWFQRSGTIVREGEMEAMGTAGSSCSLVSCVAGGVIGHGHYAIGAAQLSVSQLVALVGVAVEATQGGHGRSHAQ